MRRNACHILLSVGLGLAVNARAAAQSALAGEAIRIARAPGPIAVDGDLSDEGWRGASRVEKWYEVNPGDNVEPPVKTVAYLTYDARFFMSRSSFRIRTRRRFGRRSAITTT